MSQPDLNKIFLSVKSHYGALKDITVAIGSLSTLGKNFYLRFAQHAQVKKPLPYILHYCVQIYIRHLVGINLCIIPMKNFISICSTILYTNIHKTLARSLHQLPILHPQKLCAQAHNFYLRNLLIICLGNKLFGIYIVQIQPLFNMPTKCKQGFVNKKIMEDKKK